jgi:site-specific DNA recombinase
MATHNHTSLERYPYPLRRAVIYARVSTEIQEDDGTSLDVQIEHCQERARELGVRVIKTFREVFTGSLYRERPDLTRLREMARNNEFEVILINSFDRLSRNQTHLAVLVDEMEHLGIQIECVKEKFDDTPTGQFMRNALGFVAEVERQKIIERTQDGIKRRLQDGKLLPSWKPRYGFAWATEAKESYIFNEDEIEVVRTIFSFVVNEYRPVERIAKILSAREIPSPTGKQYWDKSTVYRILTDPIYIGKLYARKDEVKRVGGRIQRKRRPIEEMMLMPSHLVPKAIDEETFERAQEVLALNKMESRRNTPKSANDLLRCGFIRCGYCGRIMTSCETGKGTTTRRYYMCFYRYRSNRRCQQAPSISVKKIDALVWEYVGELIKDFSLVEKAIEHAKMRGGFFLDLEGIERSMDLAIADRDQYIADLKQKDEHGVLKLKGNSRNLVIDALSQTEDYLAELEDEKRKIQAGQLEWEKMQEEVDKFIAWCLNARENYEAATYEEKRRALRMLGILVYVFRSKDPDNAKYKIELTIPDLRDILLHTSISVRITFYATVRKSKNKHTCRSSSAPR